MDSSATNGEIDLDQLLIRISNVVSRNRITFIVALLLGLVSGWLFHLLNTPHFGSSMVIESRILSFPNGNSLVSTLNKLISDGNKQLLSQKLGLEAAQAATLRSIEAEDLRESVKILEKEEPSTIRISVKILDNQVLPSLETGIINYLENNPYVKKRIEIEKKNLESLRQRIQNEILQLTQLKAGLNQDLSTRNTNTNITVIDPANVYKELIELYQAELEAGTQLELIDNIQVIESFTPFNQPASQNLTRNLISGAAAGLLLISVIVFIRELNRYLIQVRQNQ